MQIAISGVVRSEVTGEDLAKNPKEIPLISPGEGQPGSKPAPAAVPAATASSTTVGSSTPTQVAPSTYDLSIKPFNLSETMAAKRAEDAKIAERKSQFEENTRKYEAESCEWVTDIPRRIVKGPSCGKTPMEICTGFVVCNQKAPGVGKFIRQSSCSKKYCTKDNKDAVACTKDQEYSSVKPVDEIANSVSKKVKNSISSPEGASAQ